MDDIAALAHVTNQDVTPRVVKLEKENQDLRNSMYILHFIITITNIMVYANSSSMFFMKTISSN